VVRSRTVFAVSAAAGVLGVARGVIGYANPNYWSPVSALDWTAISLFSALMLAAAATLSLLARRLRGAARWSVGGAAVGAALVGVGNAVEDGLGFAPFGYVFGAGMALMATSLLLAGLLLALRRAGSTQLGLLLTGVVPALALAFDDTGLIVFGLALTLTGLLSRRPLGQVTPAPE
jgi:hypothetical protein